MMAQIILRWKRNRNSTKIGFDDKSKIDGFLKLFNIFRNWIHYHVNATRIK